MVAAHICDSCRGFDLARLGLEGRSEPEHCYGRADRPAPPGVLGGYRCSCSCRSWDPTQSLSALTDETEADESDSLIPGALAGDDG